MTESAEQKRWDSRKGVEGIEHAVIIQKQSLTNILYSEHLFICHMFHEAPSMDCTLQVKKTLKVS